MQKIFDLMGVSKIFIAILLIAIFSTSYANAEDLKLDQPGAIKERLVLMPLRLDAEIQHLQGAVETSLVEGLQRKYEVFYGETVAKKAHEIFLKESKNTAHTECDETRCLQGIAESFQSELLAIANINKQDQGYFLSLVIRNIFDDKVVFSKSIACETCNSYRAVDKMKELSGAVLTAKPNEVPNLYYVFGDAGSGAGGAVYDFGVGYLNRNSASTLQNFGIEIGYANLGAFSVDSNTVSIVGGSSYTIPNPTVQGLLIPITYNIGIFEKSLLQLRVGYASMNTSAAAIATDSNGVHSNRGSLASISGVTMYGIGYDYEVINKLILRIKYDTFGSLTYTGEQGTNFVLISAPTMFTAGVAYSF